MANQSQAEDKKASYVQRTNDPKVSRAGGNHHGNGRWVSRLGIFGSCAVALAFLITLGIGELTCQQVNIRGLVIANLLIWLFFFSGLIFESVLLAGPNWRGLIRTVINFLVRLIVLFGAFWLVVNRESASQEFVFWLAIGALSATLGWLVGIVLAHRNARIPVYDDQI